MTYFVTAPGTAAGVLLATSSKGASTVIAGAGAAATTGAGLFITFYFVTGTLIISFFSSPVAMSLVLTSFSTSSTTGTTTSEAVLWAMGAATRAVDAIVANGVDFIVSAVTEAEEATGALLATASNGASTVIGAGAGAGAAL
jgi:hypothetical protein